MPWVENKGLYILVLKLAKETTITIGKLGTFTFPPGTYCYVGQARAHLRQRLARHCRKNKPLRWHIDYFLPHVEMQAILLFPPNDTAECALAQQVAKKGGIPFPPRFGASDCRCPGHLIHFPAHHTHRILPTPTKSRNPLQVDSSIPKM